MDENDKRNSSVPESASRGSTPKRASEPDLFDGREQTLPRFTIDPSDAPRQRTRTLLGVPSSIANEEAAAPANEEAAPFAFDFDEGGTLCRSCARGGGRPLSLPALLFGGRPHFWWSSRSPP